MNEWTKNRSAIGCQRYLIRQDNTIYKFLIKSLFSSIEQKYRTKYECNLHNRKYRCCAVIEKYKFTENVYIVLSSLYDWCNKGRGMCYPVCRMVHIK